MDSNKWRVDLKKNRVVPLLSIGLWLILFQSSVYTNSIRTLANGGLESYSQQGTVTSWLTSNTSGSLGFTINLFGTGITSLFVLPQGMLSTQGAADHNATDYTIANSRCVIAGYKGDWDPQGTNPLKYGTAIINGQNAFIAHYDGISGYNSPNSTGNFQVIIIDRSDTGAGNFDVEFNYGSINLNSTDVSTQSRAFIGFTSGKGASDGNKWTLPGTLVNNRFRNGASDPIRNYRNTDTDKALTGRILIESRNGVMITPNYTTANYVLPTTITLNITAANTATRFSLGANSITTKNLLIQRTYTPQAQESFTYRLVNFGTNPGQFQNIRLSPTINGTALDLNELYTKGTFKTIKSPDRSALFCPYVWLEPSDVGTISLNGATVSKLMDKSGNNNHVTQPLSASQPTYISNTINSKPALRFDGNDFLNFSTQLFPGNSARTIIAVIKKDSTSAMPIYSDSAGGVQRFDFRTNGLADSASTTIPFSTDIGSTSQYRVAIVTIGTGENLGKTQAFHKGFKRNRTDLSAAALNTSTSGVSGIGRNSDTTNFFSGDIAEVLIYNRKLTPWQIDTITQYYRNKYALPGAETTTIPQPF